MAINVYSNKTWYVDMSDVKNKFDLLQSVLTREQFERLMYRTFREVGQKSKTLITKEVRKEYAAPYAWVQSQIKHFKLTFGGGFPVTCIIPISSTKGVIGQRFKGKMMKRALKGGRGAKGRVSAKILKGTTSVLPAKMESQGGNPPFMVGGTAFTRRTKKRFPIVRVVALAVPQMPMNRAKAGVTSQLLDYTAQRLDHNFLHMLSSGR